jgi:tetratricopeptide (TPR) repeat protein
VATETEPTPAADDGPPAPPAVGMPKKPLIIIGIVTVALWAFAIHTGSKIFMIILGVLTALLAFVLIRAFRFISKQKKVVGLLQGAAGSPEARREALAKLEEGKDKDSPTNLFARAQLMAADNPNAALKLLEKTPLKDFPPAMQDDVALLRTQLYLGLGRTQDARKTADTINLDNPERKQARALAASIIGEAWARTGKPKEALALLDTIEIPKKDGEQIALQIRVAKIFAKFAMNNRKSAETDLQSLSEDDMNQLGRFLDPRFRVHPELQKLARRVLERNPAARRVVKSQGGGARMARR